MRLASSGGGTRRKISSDRVPRGESTVRFLAARPAFDSIRGVLRPRHGSAASLFVRLVHACKTTLAYNFSWIT